MKLYIGATGCHSPYDISDSKTTATASTKASDHTQTAE